MSAVIDPNIRALHARLSMDDLEIVEQLGLWGWTLVADGRGYRWEKEKGVGGSAILMEDEQVVSMAREMMSRMDEPAAPVEAAPGAPTEEPAAVLPDDLSALGWVLLTNHGMWFCRQEEANLTTGMKSKVKAAFDEAREIQARQPITTQETSEELPEMPQDLADVGWTFKREGDELYAEHEERYVCTSRDQSDPAVVIAEAYSMQEDYERSVEEANRVPVRPNTTAPDEQLLPVDSIRLDGDTQTRAQLDMLTITNYAELMRGGTRFPPVEVFFDGEHYWLADGFHRVAGTKQAEITEINANIRPGTQRDAILFSVGANALHGLPRTNADKRRAVEKLLTDEEWRGWTDGRIADAAGVSPPFVKSIRDEFTQKGLESPAVRIGKDGRKIDTSNIGDREAATAAAEAQPELPGAAAVETAAGDAPAAVADNSLSNEEPKKATSLPAGVSEAPGDTQAAPVAAAPPEVTPAQTAAVAAPAAAGVAWPEQHLIITFDIKAGKSSKRAVTISGRAGEGVPVFLTEFTLADLEPMSTAFASLVGRLGGGVGAPAVTPTVEAEAEAAPTNAPAKKGGGRKPAKRATKKAAAKKTKSGKAKQPAKQARG